LNPPTYPELVRALFPRLTGGIRWGLERTRRMLAAVGDPQRSYRIVHVGGTNGKGSVAATVESVLRADGRRTGLYTSPHLCTFRERIQVGGEPLSEAAIVRAAERLWPIFEEEGPTFFEATTVLALLAFAEAGVEAAVIEVGLGGRLDATNVVTPEVVVLTNVALDHTDYLGSTLVEVAREKAGIIKAGVPVATAERGTETLEVFRRRAEELGAPLRVLDPGEVRDAATGVDGTRYRLSDSVWGALDLHTPLIGLHQAQNTALAVRALEMLSPELRPGREAVLQGVGSTRVPGRLQVERVDGQSYVFDVAHNPAGAQVLASALAGLDVPRPIVFVVAVLADKDHGSMLRILQEVGDAVVLTDAPSAPSGRRWDLEVVAREGAWPGAEAVPDLAEALVRGAELAAGGTVVVTGSFHTVGDALIVLGRAPYGIDPPLPVSVATV